MLAGLFSRFSKTSLSKYDRLLKEQLDQLRSSSFNPSFKNLDSELYLRAVELNEFRSFGVLLVGPYFINSSEGCTLTFISEQGEMMRKSDSTTVKGEYSKPLQIGVINFDIDRDDELLGFIRSNTITGARFETKNGALRKELVVIEWSEVDQDALHDSLEYKEPDEEDIIYEEVLAEEQFSEEE